MTSPRTVRSRSRSQHRNDSVSLTNDAAIQLMTKASSPSPRKGRNISGTRSMGETTYNRAPTMTSRRRRDVPAYSPLMVALTSRGSELSRAPTPGVPGRVAVREAVTSERSAPQRRSLAAAMPAPFSGRLGLSGSRSRLPGELETCVIGDPLEQVGVQTSAHEPSSQGHDLAETGQRLLAGSGEQAEHDPFADRHQRRAGQPFSGQTDEMPGAGVTCLLEQVVGVGADESEQNRRAHIGSADVMAAGRGDAADQPRRDQVEPQDVGGQRDRNGDEATQTRHEPTDGREPQV